ASAMSTTTATATASPSLPGYATNRVPITVGEGGGQAIIAHNALALVRGAASRLRVTAVIENAAGGAMVSSFGATVAANEGPADGGGTLETIGSVEETKAGQPLSKMTARVVEEEGTDSLVVTLWDWVSKRKQYEVGGELALPVSWWPALARLAPIACMVAAVV